MAAPAQATSSEFQIPSYCSGYGGIKKLSNPLFVYFPVVKANVFTSVAGTERVGIVPCGTPESKSFMLVTNNSNGRWVKYQYLKGLTHAHMVSATTRTVVMSANIDNRTNGVWRAKHTGRWSTAQNKFVFSISTPASVRAADTFILNLRAGKSTSNVTLSSSEKTKIKSFLKGTSSTNYYQSCDVRSSSVLTCELGKTKAPSKYLTYTLTKKNGKFDVSSITYSAGSWWEV